MNRRAIHGLLKGAEGNKKILLLSGFHESAIRQADYQGCRMWNRVGSVGFLNSMTIAPGKHRARIDLPGDRSFETEMSVLSEQKVEIKTDLFEGSIEQVGLLTMQR